MRGVFVVVVAVLLSSTLFTGGPVYALQDGKHLQADCTRGNSFADGYCEGFIIGVLSAHMSPWVISLQKGRTYFCIPGNLTFKQITAAIQKYLSEHANLHRYRADVNIWTAATETYPCPE